MTTYTAIASTEVDADSPLTDTLMTRLRDNPLAIAEGASEAPYIQTAWHPYNSVVVGDAFTGRLWDFATNGAVIDVVTPYFLAGYEYRMRMHGLTASSVATLVAQFYTDAGAYTSSLTLGAMAPTAVGDGFVEVLDPGRISRHKYVRAQYSETTTLFTTFSPDNLVSAATAFKITKFKIGLPSGGLVAGSVFLDRRRIYA